VDPAPRYSRAGAHASGGQGDHGVESRLGVNVVVAAGLGVDVLLVALVAIARIGGNSAPGGGFLEAALVLGEAARLAVAARVARAIVSRADSGTRAAAFAPGLALSHRERNRLRGG